MSKMDKRRGAHLASRNVGRPHDGRPMLLAGLLMICVGLIGFSYAVAPHLFERGLTRIYGSALSLEAFVSQQVVLSVSGAFYLSGIVLIAAQFLRDSAVRILRQVANERADLEALYGVGSRSIERLEAGLLKADTRRENALREARRLASDFEAGSR